MKTLFRLRVTGDWAERCSSWLAGALLLMACTALVVLAFPWLTPPVGAAVSGAVVLAWLVLACVAPPLAEGGWPQAPAATRPRAWSVFVAWLVAVVGAVGLQAAAAVGVAAWLWALGREVRGVQDLLLAPAGYVVLGLLGQGAFAATAILFACSSPEPTAARLGLRAPSLSGWAYPILLVASLFPLAVGIKLSQALAGVIPPNPAGEQMLTRLTWPDAVAFLLFVTVAPALAEELLFRGYIQRRLLQRWPPWVAIAVTSALFALVHLDPHLIVVAVPMGAWLGFLVWKAGSIWPGVCCHAFVNFTWTAWRIGQRFADWPEPTSGASLAVLLAVGLGCTVLATRGTAASRPGP